MTKPIHIQRKRSNGYNMQAESLAINGLPCIYVGRPTLWSNPFTIGCTQIGSMGTTVEAKTNTEAVAMFGRLLNLAETKREYFEYPLNAEIKRKLAGHNLSCWCSLDSPCHADILLEIANS